MLGLNRRQVYRIARRKGLLSGLGSQRGNASAHIEMVIKSPREIYNHLSQYIIGQEKAKRTLSVAVFNHFTRITPPPAAPPDTTAEVVDKAPAVAIPTPRPRPRFDVKDGQRITDVGGDITKVTGAEEGADPTLTHDLLSRSREGQWTRDGGYFSSSKAGPEQALLSRAMRQRKNASGRDRIPEETWRNNINLSGTSKVVGPGESKGKGKAKEEVVLEKSNVLMIGPTGTGKTLMAKTLARILDVPFATCDATSYTQAGYVGEDVENCVLRLLQAAEYDVNRTEIGIIHIDEIDKLARRGGGEGAWGGGRDVGGEGVQQALLRLLEGTNVTLSAKPPPISSTSSSSSTSPSSPSSSSSSTPGGSGSGSGSGAGPKAEAGGASGAYEPPNWDPNNPMNRSFGGPGGKKGVREGLPGFGGGGGGASGGKGETFVVDTSNILFILSGAFVGLESIVQRRLGKGSIGFGAPLPKPTLENLDHAPSDPTPLKGLSAPDLQTYGLIPEFLGRLPILSTLHPLSDDDLIRILTQPRNALIKQYTTIFERYGSELKFTEKGLRAVANEGLKRGGGARGLRGVLEEILSDTMFEVPESSVRYCLITEAAVQGFESARYYSRGQKHLFHQDLENEDRPNGGNGARIEEVESEEEGIRATG